MDTRLELRRRDFVKTAALVSAGLLVNESTSPAKAADQAKPAAGAGPDCGKPFCKAVKYGMVAGNMSMLEKFKLLKELGFDGVEMDSPNEFDAKEVVRARDESGLPIPGVVDSAHWKQHFSHNDPKVRAQGVEALKTALRDAKTYGATTVLVVPGVVDKDTYYDDAYKRSQEEIRKVLPVAQETGVKLAFENVWNNFLLSPMEAARYVDEFESPMVGWHFDVGNVVRSGWPEHWIRVLGKRILKLDIKEYSRKKRDEEGLWKGFDVELLEGDCDWPAVMKALKEIGYKGWVAAEIRGGGRERLQDIAKRMDRIFAS
jgi:hexulose-6-phosphate isomerase